MNNAYETDIGIEVHVQLKTKSKIFCSSAVAASEQPNTHICPVCTAQPGVLPVFNQEVIRAALMAALATDSTVNRENEFARKHYFYPDLPKNYQITQNNKPLGIEGSVSLRLDDGSVMKVRLIRIHIEEDAGKNIHAAHTNESFVDLNRAGTPLLEIVSYPDIKSAAQARAYLKTLRNIILYLDIGTGSMEEGAFRADTNVSVRRRGQEKLGTRCELKNINSFKFISDAIEFEVERQIALLERGEKVVQETRSWDTKEHKTVLLRSKEEAADYRYFPDPDLPKIIISQEQLDAVRKDMPELPHEKFDRLCAAYSLTPYEAEILINNLPLADYYERAARITPTKSLIHWVLRDVLKTVKEGKVELADVKVTPEKLAQLVALLDKGTINNRVGQELFLEVAQTGEWPEEIVKRKGLEQVGSASDLEAIIQAIIAENPQNVAAYRQGKEKLWGFFVGQAMQKTQGRGNPHLINELLKKYLSGEQ